MSSIKDVLVPANEEGTRATILKWCKAVGDTVVKDEPLVELETDKVTVEIPAPASGTSHCNGMRAALTQPFGASVTNSPGGARTTTAAIWAFAPLPCRKAKIASPR